MEPRSTVADVIRKYFSDFVSRNREAVEEVLADDFVFHSPHDPHIGTKIYFEKCWPDGENYRAIRIEKLFCVGDEAFVRYECENKSGLKFRQRFQSRDR